MDPSVVVQVSEGRISLPTTAQYRTVPLRPHNVTFDPALVSPRSFTVRWSGPAGIAEFDRYQVAIGIRRKTPQIVERGQPLVAEFRESLQPGRTYQVVVKTVSGSVASWPATGNVTTRPLAVVGLQSSPATAALLWRPNTESTQDSYKVGIVQSGSLNIRAESVVRHQMAADVEK